MPFVVARTAKHKQIIPVMIDFAAGLSAATDTEPQYEPRHEKTCLRGLPPGKTQTGLLSYRDELEARNFGYRN